MQEAQATYRGLIHIGKNASKTRSFLNGHSLLLGQKAKANSIPSLEILSNDVQSRHGATVDHLDEEKIFYLNTRGYSRKQAEKTVVEGFVGEVFEKSEERVSKQWQDVLAGRLENVE